MAAWVVSDYLNGRGERSQTDPGDLNVPMRLTCDVRGRDRWKRIAAGQGFQGRVGCHR
jgi:hypothetical protein